MDKQFYKCYYKYFLWNEGLIDHFFSEGKREILLYVDKKLLEEIGEKAGLKAEDYMEDFLSCVEDFCSCYNQYICPKGSPNKDKPCQYTDCRYYTCLKKDGRGDVLAVANHMCMAGISYYFKYEDEKGNIRIRIAGADKKKAEIHRLPFLSIVIYVITKFDMGNVQEWKNVGQEISPHSRPYIKSLWEKIHDFNSRFDKDASVYERSNAEYDDYAGRILYHLPLSSSMRNKIQDAIYKSSVWKLADSRSFEEIVGFITHSLKDVKSNEELFRLLKDRDSTGGSKGILARKIQTVIDSFDIDAYEAKLEERKGVKDFGDTIISGRFALGIYLPEDSEISENSIVLLTTVQQHVSYGDFEIQEGGSGTLAGYNTSFVKFQDSQTVELKAYSINDKLRRIAPLPCKDVVFFYEYDKCLFIQTEDFIPASSYIIAARGEQVKTFAQWCTDHGNDAERFPHENTKDLFGDEWTVFYIHGIVNGSYYNQPVSEDVTGNSGSRTIVMKGGVKNSRGVYFINALPYFDVPDCYDVDKVKVYLNLNGQTFDRFDMLVKGNKIVLDVKDFPRERDIDSYIDICLECDQNTRFHYSISFCGQAIMYNAENFYRYDRFGVVVEQTQSYAYLGSFVNECYRLPNAERGFTLRNEQFDSISDDLYFTNLLAACCYDSDTSEIAHDKFRKCVSYAAARLGIDIQREGFISNTKKILAQAGILNIDYANNKCQALPPTFIRIPFSIYSNPRAMLIMLSGCYTRSFISDLLKYCKKEGVGVYAVRNNNERRDEEKLLPPIIILDYNFNVDSFSHLYKHECETVLDYDFALSLLNMIPEVETIKSRFDDWSERPGQFLDSLNRPTSTLLPRIRTRGEGFRKRWYLENLNNVFAGIPVGFVTWASIYCHLNAGRPMIVVNKRDDSVFLPSSLFLPTYVQRALYLMNVGLPEIYKVFVCDDMSDNYYVHMCKYKLYSSERCKVLASKLTGNNTNSVRYSDDRCFTGRMEYWLSKFDGKKYRERYLLLYDDGNTDGALAIVYRQKVYLYRNSGDNDGYYRIDRDATYMNEVLTFLIRESWKFLPGRSSIGYSRQGGESFEKCYDVTEEQIEMPNAANFSKEQIIIV